MASSYSVDLDAMKSRLGEPRVIQLTDDQGAGAIDSAKVSEAIDAAEAEFHLYAGVYYSTPVRKSDNTVPPGIREKLIEATAWRLMNRRAEFLRGDTDEGKYWAQRRAEVLDWLMAIAEPDPKKRLLIPDAKDKSTLAVRAGVSSVKADEAQYTHDTLKEW